MMEQSSKINIKTIVSAFVWVIVLIALDQYTKYLAIVNLKGNSGITLIENVFRLYYLENTGAAFGILEQKQIFLIALTIILFIAVLLVYLKIPKTKKYLPLNIICYLVFAGGIGNLIDRVRFNYVVDFFYFELIDFPVFNVADCYITVSMIVLILLILFYYKEEDLAFLSFKKKESKDNEY